MFFLTNILQTINSSASQLRQLRRHYIQIACIPSTDNPQANLSQYPKYTHRKKVHFCSQLNAAGQLSSQRDGLSERRNNRPEEPPGYHEFLNNSWATSEE